MTRITSADLSAPAGQQTTGGVTCPPGQKAIGGGADIAGSATGVNLNSTFPDSSADGGPIDSWVAVVNNATTTATTFAVFAMCANTN